MTEQVRVAVVGGGIVGCAVLYCLAKRGWSDTVLLERQELTSGSTWHAAGNVTHFGHYAEITRLYVDSLRVYLQAEAESGQSIGFHKTGSLRLATNRSELDAYRGL
ncbi:MAG: FAD-dependent oxidoreductase, partial [Rhodobacteraceae bacterium]|nr:FAD-dependent oxidoreductase [Paracoccaceae bacterium]